MKRLHGLDLPTAGKNALKSEENLFNHFLMIS